MEFVFWQNIISIHQKDFLEALARQPSVEKVTLVVDHDITIYRKNMGWEVPEIVGVTVVISPDYKDVPTIVLSNRNAVHVVGGIRIGRMNTIAFEECVKNNCRLGVMTEPYNSTGIKGKLRAAKYFWYKLRYFRYVQFVLAIGRQAERQYRALGYNKERLFPWAYFINLEAGERKDISPGSNKRIIYAGRLEEGKGIYNFIEELANTEHKNYRFDIYGTGPDEERIKQLVREKGMAEQIHFHAFLAYKDLLKRYAAYDWVALPSMYKEGWGVIVSEGLLNGLKAICSDICGVSWAIKNGFNGVVFSWTIPGSCKAAIEGMFSGNKFADVVTIKEWAVRSITGEAGAEYFMKIMDCVYGKKERPGVPWKA